MTKKKRSSVEHYIEAKEAAENADDFAWMTEPGPGRRQNSRQRKAGTGSIKDGTPSAASVKKYGKWAKEEAATAHKARSKALKRSKEEKMAKGGVCRGMGSATSGGKFGRDG